MSHDTARDTVDELVPVAAASLRRHSRAVRRAILRATARAVYAASDAAAEAVVQLAETRADEPGWPPAADDIRLASDFPVNQPLRGPRG